MLNSLANLAMSTSVLKALAGKLDIKRHSPSILYLFLSQMLMMTLAVIVQVIVYLLALVTREKIGPEVRHRNEGEKKTDSVYKIIIL